MQVGDLLIVVIQRSRRFINGPTLTRGPLQGARGAYAKTAFETHKFESETWNR